MSSLCWYPGVTHNSGAAGKCGTDLYNFCTSDLPLFPWLPLSLSWEGTLQWASLLLPWFLALQHFFIALKHKSIDLPNDSFLTKITLYLIFIALEPGKWKWNRSVVSDSLRPHGLQPIRLLCTWDFLGNSTGVDCRFLFQGIFPTQGSNLGLPWCRQTLYRLSHQRSPLNPVKRSTFDR